MAKAPRAWFPRRMSRVTRAERCGSGASSAVCQAIRDTEKVLCMRTVPRGECGGASGIRDTLVGGL